MNIKRLAVLTLVLSMVAGGAAIAGSRWGSYEGYSKVQVSVNDRVLSDGEVPAFVVNGSTMLPLREVANSLNAIVKWDGSNQTANIYKPNVNMFVSREVSKDYSSIKTPFGRVSQGSAMSFFVFVQVDNLLTDVSGSKLSIIDPYGNEVDSREEGIYGSPSDFWYANPFKVTFSESGNYKVRFALNVDGSYVTVAEKLIVSE